MCTCKLDLRVDVCFILFSLFFELHLCGSGLVYVHSDIRSWVRALPLHEVKVFSFVIGAVHCVVCVERTASLHAFLIAWP